MSNNITTFSIDLASLKRRSLGNNGFMLRMLEQFELSSGNQIDEITILTAACDTDAISEIAHSLKGAAAIIGAHHLSSLAAKIEDSVESGEIEKIYALLGRLRLERVRCLHEIESIRQRFMQPSILEIDAPASGRR